jgi:hypothetical protein
MSYDIKSEIISSPIRNFGFEPNLQEIAKLQKICIDNTPEFYNRLEGQIFPGVERAIIQLDTSGSTVGNAKYFKSNITPSQVRFLSELAKNQVMLPVQDGPYGIDMKDIGSQIFLRQFLYFFHGTRLWTEEIAPHFNNALLEPILRNKEFVDKCCFKITNKNGLSSLSCWGIRTPKSELAEDLTNLASRAGIDINNKNFFLHSAICNQLRIEFPGSDINNKAAGWDERYKTLWIAHEDYLFPPELLKYMEGKKTVRINVNAMSPFSGEGLRHIMTNPETIDYILNNLGNDNKRPFSGNPIINDAVNGILSHMFSLVYAGGRKFNREFVTEHLDWWIKQRSNEYTFAAVIREEYLEPSKD